jgi:hypothetical protein
MTSDVWARAQRSRAALLRLYRRRFVVAMRRLPRQLGERLGTALPRMTAAVADPRDCASNG